MSTVPTQKSRAVEYAVIACVAAGMLFGVVHLVRRTAATQNRLDAIASGCRPVVVAQATLLAQKYPGLKWSIDGINVLGKIEADKPDQNTCAVSMTFNVGGRMDKELWTVDALYGSFRVGSVRLAGVEINQ